MDKTTDIEEQTVERNFRMIVANFIVGALEIGSPKKNISLNGKISKKRTIKMFDNSLSLLWPEGVKYANVLLYRNYVAPVFTIKSM